MAALERRSPTPLVHKPNSIAPDRRTALQSSPLSPPTPCVRLYYGNCLDLLDAIAAKYPEGRFDAIFADPPYFLSNGGITCHAGKMVRVDKGDWDKSRGPELNHEFNLEWLARCQRVLEPNGTIWVSGTQHVIFSIGYAMQQLGYNVLNDIAWEKPNPPPNLSCRYFTHSTETILWAAKNEKSKHVFNCQEMRKVTGKQMKTVWRDVGDEDGRLMMDDGTETPQTANLSSIRHPQSSLGSVWTMSAPGGAEKEHGKHPTQKPVALIERCLLASTNAGDLVLDPFLGDGTTAIAAITLKRGCVAVEADLTYVSIATKRADKEIVLIWLRHFKVRISFAIVSSLWLESARSADATQIDLDLFSETINGSRVTDKPELPTERTYHETKFVFLFCAEVQRGSPPVRASGVCRGLPIASFYWQHSSAAVICFPRMKWIALFVGALLTLNLRADTNVLTLIKTIPLPEVRGRIDHFALDVQGQRLFMAALGNDTVEVIDLATGKRIRTIGDCSEPQGVAFAPAENRLLIANGGSGVVKIFNATSFQMLHEIDNLRDADNTRYDSGWFYVGYGSGALAVINATNGELVASIKLDGHPESFQLERNGSRIFVNVPDARQVAVVDRDKRAVMATWPMETFHGNFPMALNEANHRLFIGCRSPARLIALDLTTGKRGNDVEISRDTDDVFYDAQRKRIYASCGGGFIDVIDADNYEVRERIATRSGARTSFFSPERGELFLAVRAGMISGGAEIRVYKCN